MPGKKPDVVRRLPAGRHGLSPEQVQADQRRRILKALAAVASSKGYAEITVSDIVAHARVSRPTFYELFVSKQECFLAGHARVQQRMVDDILAVPTTGSPMDRFADLLQRYLAALNSDRATSRLYLVSVYEAGPEAIRRRIVIQQRFVDGVATVFRARSKADRFACTSLVAAISMMVTFALVDEDGDVLALHAPLLDVTERLMGRLIARAAVT